MQGPLAVSCRTMNPDWLSGLLRGRRLFQLSRPTYRYQSTKDVQAALRLRMKEMVATRINDCQAMDVMPDDLFDGSRIRLLTIVDHLTRASRGIVAGQRLCGRDVVDALTRTGFDRSRPKTIRVDNGPESTSKIPDQWAYAHQVTLDFSRPGKPTENAFIEPFNGRIRAECLNGNWFLSIDDARQKVEAWRQDYNNHRPHSALGNLAPENSLVPARQLRIDSGH